MSDEGPHKTSGSDSGSELAGDDGRDRIGVIVPSSNTTVEPEFERATADDVTIHSARMALESVTVDELDAMSDDAVRGGELLAHAAVDAVAYACTTGSLLHGPGFDVELEERLEDAAGVPAVATARSVCRALEGLAVERVGVVTPYTEALDEREAEFLEVAGFDVVAIDGRGIEANTAIGTLDPDDAYEQATAMADGRSLDAVFISCTNYRSLAAVDRLEGDLGVPVVTSNGATLWDICRVASIDIDAPGALFDRS
ncbi:maleate cis-trans isomerase [Halostagnicola larsenii XH-48]|uniref:Maleate cis-trans isomerase n=1 Tax=Halostagnicola larsenii XH-48 TaxID=797299 RepID=W0JKN9_9EURY|nr:aspartate/glutamate racemase family protein [Halostagnicola larsenii]AHF99173.1 maleate cis-trans isomerase [Halostagnicola larsenii XH-48]